MPLPVKDILKSQIIAASPQGVAFDQWADNLAQIILNTITAATVTVNTGIPVATAGSPAAQTGATTSPGTGSLS
jgi:hypothetical protein